MAMALARFEQSREQNLRNLPVGHVDGIGR
jgi:hypothetical protein